MTKSRPGWLWFMAAASPALVPLAIMLHYEVNFHFWDEWAPGWAGLAVKLHHHQLTFHDLVAQHNEHRVLFPRLLLLLLFPLTHFNNIANLLVFWSLLCGVSLFVLRLSRQTADDPQRHGGRTIFLWFLANLLLFTPAQHTFFFWGIGFQNLMPNIFVLLGFVVACSRRRYWSKVAVCVLLASAATYSSGSGVLAWPLVGLLLIWPAAWNQRRLSKSAASVWITACLLNLGLYFVSYAKPAHGSEPVYASSAHAIVGHAVAFLGNSLAFGTNFPPVPVALTVGSVLLAILLAAVGDFVYCWRHQQREVCDRILIWLAVAGYGFFSGVLSAFFRAGLGVEAALDSRYVIYGLYVPLASIYLVPIMADHLASVRARSAKLALQLPAVLAAPLLILQMLAFAPALEKCQEDRLKFRQAKAALLLANIFPDNPQLTLFVCPVRDQLFDEARALSDMGYLQPPLIVTNDAQRIRQDPPDPAAQSIGHFDGIMNISGQPTAVGWAINPRVGEIADAVFLTCDDEHQEPIIFSLAVLNVKRDDVAAQLHSQDYQWCGWIAPLSLDRLPADIHVIRIMAWALDTDTGKAWPLDGVFTVQR